MAKRPTKKSKGAKPKPKRVVAPPAERPITVISGTKVARVLAPPVGSSRDADRTYAASKFIYDVEQHTIDWWHAKEFAHIPYNTFRKWASQDAWHNRRSEFIQNVERSVASRIATEVVEQRVGELKELMDARRVIAGYVTGKDASGNAIALSPPKTLGEAVSAFVKIDERVDEKRTIIVADLPLTVGSSDAKRDPASVGVPASLPFDDAQMRAMAHAAVRSRLALPEEVDEDPNGTPSGDDEGDSADE